MTDLISRLRDTPNWMRESYGSWKDCVLKYDRAPFEAADEIEKLRAALNDIAQHQDSEWPLRCRMNVRTARAALKEPVGWLHDETGEFEHSHQQWMESDGDWVPVYAAPQQRRPLTDEQLKQAMSDAGVRVFQPGLWDVLLDAGRAIERAHGITGEPT